MLWQGVTKSGSNKTHLSFLDKSKDFWTDSSLISEADENFTTSKYGIGRCRECGKGLRDASFHRAMGGLCGECAFDEYDM